ncbi:MAG: hypothetical protein U9N49_13300 [Campylobacterota bacterium]|nr:hypothetical protein [Campylobacterota bacterium]
MEKLELIAKKIDILINAKKQLESDKDTLSLKLDEANGKIAELSLQLDGLKESCDLKDMEMDDILSKLEEIVLDR